MSGPVTSASTIPVFPDSARTQARFVATVDFPVPPFPDITTILCLMRDIRWAIFMRSRIAAMMCGGIWAVSSSSAMKDTRWDGVTLWPAV